jgi:hypothetical protein
MEHQNGCKFGDAVALFHWSQLATVLAEKVVNGLGLDECRQRFLCKWQ